MTSDASRPYVVVLAGGIGSRFWPASRPERPKQLLPLGSPSPLIVDTLERARAITDESRIRVIAREPLIERFLEAVPELTGSNALVEPKARGTGPALAWAAHHIFERDPNAVMVSLHADHVISPVSEFRAAIEHGTEAAGQGRLLCLGIAPDRPETGYGYVRAGSRFRPSVLEATEFVEKPDPETARRYLESGEFFWNSGIFIWRAADLLEAVRRHAPEIALRRLDEGDVVGFFEESTPISIDVAVLERAENVAIVECGFRWEDVGGWNALGRTRDSDAAGNVIVGDAELFDASDNIVWAEDGKITLFGVQNLVVVRSGGETFVTTREAAADMKRMWRDAGAGTGGSR